MTKVDERADQELEIINLDLLDNVKKSPWKQARALDDTKAAQFLGIKDIYSKISTYNNPRDKALYACAYITAARIEELVRHTKIKWGKKRVILVRDGKSKTAYVTDYKKKKVLNIKPSIKKSDFILEYRNGRKVWLIRMRNLKNKQAGENIKLIPLPLDDEINQMFFKIINDYITVLAPDEELFPLTKRRAEQIISKAGSNPHFLRKVRLTHLVKYYNFSDQKLKTFAGWTDSRPAKHYIKIGWEDLVNSM